MKPDIKQYKITCLRCKQSSRINIMNSQKVVYVDHTPIIACRLRGDMKWGFECMCGNDNRLAIQEKSQISTLVQNASERTIKKIADTLKIKDEKQFKMEVI